MNWSLNVLLMLWTIPFALTVYNCLTWPRLTAPHPRRRPPGITLSVLIPARNEASNIDQVIASIVNTHDLHSIVEEILVYDDQSTDETAHIVLSWAARDERVHLIRGVTLPEGWVGKPHACQKLLEGARGSHVLFLDADVRLKADALAHLAELVPGDGRGTLVTAVPQQMMQSPVEALMLPLLHLTYLAWLPLNWSNRQRDPAFSAACGQVVFAARSDLIALGGFYPVARALVDDLALVRFAKVQGLQVNFADGFNIATCRMYRTPKQIWRGFSKNLYLGMGSSAAFLVALFLHVTCFVLPYICVIGGAYLPGWFATPWLVLGCFGALGNVAMRWALARRFAHPLWSVIFHPFAVGALIALAFNSWRWVKRGAVLWAERSYVPHGSTYPAGRANHA